MSKSFALINQSTSRIYNIIVAESKEIAEEFYPDYLVIESTPENQAYIGFRHLGDGVLEGLPTE